MAYSSRPKSYNKFQFSRLNLSDLSSFFTGIIVRTGFGQIRKEMQHARNILHCVQDTWIFKQTFTMSILLTEILQNFLVKKKQKKKSIGISRGFLVPSTLHRHLLLPCPMSALSYLIHTLHPPPISPTTSSLLPPISSMSLHLWHHLPCPFSTLPLLSLASLKASSSPPSILSLEFSTFLRCYSLLWQSQETGNSFISPIKLQRNMKLM